MIDRAFRRVSRLMDVDHAEQFEYTQQELDHLQVVTEAKNVLYDHYGYAARRCCINSYG